MFTSGLESNIVRSQSSSPYSLSDWIQRATSSCNRADFNSDILIIQISSWVFRTAVDQSLLLYVHPVLIATFEASDTRFKSRIEHQLWSAVTSKWNYKDQRKTKIYHLWDSNWKAACRPQITLKGHSNFLEIFLKIVTCMTL